jgi:MFS transporter, ACS family, glucarate transporter
MKFLSWRWTFVVFAVFGVAWVAFFRAWFRDDPRRHPGVNEAERALLPPAEEVQVGGERTPWRVLLASPQVWWLCGQYFCQGVFFYFVVNWMPTYLQEARAMSPAKSALWAGLPMFLGGIGCLLGGLLLRRLTARLSPLLARKIIPIGAFLLAAASLFAVPQMRSGEAAVIAIGLAIFGNDLSMATCWNACTEMGGKYAGTVGGQMNMWGHIGGFLSPLIISHLLDVSDQNWNLTFTLCAGIYLLGIVFWLLLDPVTPLRIQSPAPSPSSS